MVSRLLIIDMVRHRSCGLHQGPTPELEYNTLVGMLFLVFFNRFTDNLAQNYYKFFIFWSNISLWSILTGVVKALLDLVCHNCLLQKFRPCKLQKCDSSRFLVDWQLLGHWQISLIRPCLSHDQQTRRKSQGLENEFNVPVSHKAFDLFNLERKQERSCSDVIWRPSYLVY